MKKVKEKFNGKLERPQQWIRRKLSFIVLPGFEGMPLYDVLVFFFQGLNKGVLAYRAAAIAFNFFLALVPFILFLFTLIPFVVGENIQFELLNLMEEVLPQDIFKIAESTIIEVVSRPSTSWLSFVTLTALVFATNGIDAILDGFGQSYHNTKIWPWWRQKITAFLLMVGLSFLIIISMALLGFGKYALTFLEDGKFITDQYTIFFLETLQWLTICGLILLSISILYYFGEAKNKEDHKYRFFSSGSILGTVLFVLGGVLLKLYFENFARFNLIYGSLGSIIIVLLWLFYNAQILLIGYELNTSIRMSKAKKTRVRNMK